MNTLPYDDARCSARFDLEPDGPWCEERQTCQRYLAWSKWDQLAGVPHYRGIPVTMARADCDIKIPTDEVELTYCPSCKLCIIGEEELEFLGWHGYCVGCDIGGIRPEEEE